jgi:hypothetical protein
MRPKKSAKTTFTASAFLIILAGALLSGCRASQTEPGPAGDPEAQARRRGTEVVSEYLKRDASPYRQMRVRLTVSSVTERAEVYELEVWRKQAAEETLTLTRIVQPAASRDLASLTTERSGEDAINVTYVARLDQFRETGTNKSFFGGVTAQEFLGEWDKYDFRSLGEQDLNGTKGYKVEGKLKPRRDSIIARLTVLFRGDNYLPAEMHAFDSNGKELRTFRVTDYRNFAGRAMVGRMEIENQVYKTNVLVEVLDVTFPGTINEKIFTRERLKEIAQG